MTSKWIKTTVGKFCPFIYGKSLPEQARKNGSVPVISSAGISGKHNKPLVNGAGIVIGRKGTIGSVTYCPIPFWPIDTTFYVKDDPEIRDLRFTYYLLKNLRLPEMNSDSAVPGLNRETAHALTIFAPQNPKDQSRVSRILVYLDDKIELNRKTNETLETMARTLFQAWFVNFEPVRAKMEGRWKRGHSLPGLPAHLYDLFPDRLVESELGEIPLGWTVSSLYEQVSLTGGGTPKRSEPSYWGGSIPWFSVKDAPYGSDVFVIDTDEYITEHGLQNSSTRILPEGTSIISARGTVGKLALVGVPMAMNQSCYGVTGKGKIGPVFNYLNLKKTVEKLKQNTHGAVFDTITQSTFETVKVSCPPDALLSEFEELATPAFHKIKASVKESITLRNLRDTLLPRLMSGELHIPDAEQVTEKSL